MTHGRKVCNTLKEIRRQIADRNDIAYLTTDCHFEGECQGTCPKCEAELKYLENELHKRRLAGKVATVAGISLGLASTFSACNAPQQQQTDIPIIPKLETIADTVNLDTIPDVIFVSDYLGTMGEVLHSDDIIRKEDFDDEKIYKIFQIEVYPEFPGGDKELKKFLENNLVYPEDTKENRIEGRVLVSFVVNKDGRISDVEVMRSVHHILDEEAVRIVKAMPKWIPGKHFDMPINVRFSLPIEFKLNDKE